MIRYTVTAYTNLRFIPLDAVRCYYSEEHALAWVNSHSRYDAVANADMFYDEDDEEVRPSYPNCWIVRQTCEPEINEWGECAP